MDICKSGNDQCKPSLGVVAPIISAEVQKEKMTMKARILLAVAKLLEKVGRIQLKSSRAGNTISWSGPEWCS